MIELSGIVKKYTRGTDSVPVLKSIDLFIKKGDFVSITGPSGSGKSTLLHILGCLDRPTSGTYLLDGVNIFDTSDDECARLRANHIGFVFQTFNLIPSLTVFENVELPFLYADINGGRPVAERVAAAVEDVGLKDRMHHKPSELSGGEMQRVAIARAMVMNPKLILADEPTGNLDAETGREILHLFQNFHAEASTIIMVTHDKDVASCADTHIRLRDGKIA